MSRHLVATLIFFLSFLSFGYLTQRSDDNPQIITRMGLTLSIVELGRLDIDRIEARTVDKAFIGGHYYADKVPGLSLLAVPIVAVARAVWSARGETRSSADPEMELRYTSLATMSTVSLVGAIASAMLYLLALRLGADHRGATLAAFVLAFGTPFFGWSTAFFAHAATGSLLLIALAVIVRVRSTPLTEVVIGVLLGLTLVVDLTAAPAVAILGLLLLWRIRTLRVAVLAGIGGLLGLIPLLVYNQLAFGSPWVLGYSAVVGFEGMRQGFFGIGLPDPVVLYELLFGLFRGLLPLSPVLVLVPVGLWAMARRPALRPIALAVTLIVLSYLWINASYFYWTGGASTGPRHLVPFLPVAALALAFVQPSRSWQQAVVAVLVVFSLAASVVCASTDMFNLEHIPNPFYDRLLPHFLKPENLPRAAPMVVVWLVFGWLFFLPPARQPRSETS